MLKKYWVVLIILALLLNGCSVTVDPGPEVTTPVRTAKTGPQITTSPEQGGLTDTDKPPLAVLVVNGASQQAGLGTYCWTNEANGTGLCLDAIGIATPQEPLPVTAPFTAQFMIPVEEEPRDVVLSIRQAAADLEMDEDALDLRWWAYGEGGLVHQLGLEHEPAVELDLEPGLYVLDLFVSWERLGDASYGFLVEVEE
jgi:hypothetical protein